MTPRMGVLSSASRNPPPTSACRNSPPTRAHNEGMGRHHTQFKRGVETFTKQQMYRRHASGCARNLTNAQRTPPPKLSGTPSCLAAQQPMEKLSSHDGDAHNSMTTDSICGMLERKPQLAACTARMPSKAHGGARVGRCVGVHACTSTCSWVQVAACTGSRHAQVHTPPKQYCNTRPGTGDTEDTPCHMLGRI